MRAWFGRRSKGPRLELVQSLGAFPLPGGDISPLFVVFEVGNTGDSAVELRRLYVRLRGGELLDLTDTMEGERELPFTLKPGERVRFWVRAKALSRRIRDAGYGGRPRVELVVEDALRNTYEKRFRLRVDEYLSLKDE
jgi:hypothetical protein